MDLFDVYSQCQGCGKFNLIKGTKERHGNQTQGVACQFCNNTTWIQQSTVSARTFDYERAKRKEAQVVKQIKNRASKF